MYRIKNKTIYVNRGDAMTIHLVNNSDSFRIGDYINFYICEEGNMNNVLLKKTFNIDTITDSVDLALTSEDTRIGETFGSGKKTYWYEIELNKDTTLIGYDLNGPKLFILYPEAVVSEKGGNE